MCNSSKIKATTYNDTNRIISELTFTNENYVRLIEELEKKNSELSQYHEDRFRKWVTEYENQLKSANHNIEELHKAKYIQ